MARQPKRLPEPTREERERARQAAQAMRAVAAGEMKAGERGVMHIDFTRRRSAWLVTWANLPGFFFSAGKYSHACLPGWTYTRAEVRSEMIPDLEALAERGVRPTEATS
jgi:hypothetical protein